MQHELDEFWCRTGSRILGKHSQNPQGRLESFMLQENSILGLFELSSNDCRESITLSGHQRKD